MPVGQEHFALDWIKADLLETLNDARGALDDYSEAGDEMRLRSCLTSLHQVHGTLVMLNLQGVTLLADHLEQLAQALLSGRELSGRELSGRELAGKELSGQPSTEQSHLAAQYLMQGMLELPGHLEELQRGMQDRTSPFVALVNDIRTLLGEPLLEDAAGASLIAPASSEVIQRFRSMEGPDKVNRIRSAYQSVLLSLLKGQDRAGVIGTLGKIALGLQRLSAGSALERQWQAFAEFVASLASGQGPIEGDALKLLRQVDLEIKQLAGDGNSALRQSVNIELIEQMLAASVAADHTNETVEGLQQAVERDSNYNTLAIFGRQALSSAARALQEDLLIVKDKLDMLVRSSSIDLEALRSLIDPLNKVGGVLSILGFESSREIVVDQVEAIESLILLGDTDPQNVQSIAGALIQIDENLSSVVQGSEKSEIEQITSDAEVQLVREARNGLEQVKQGIVDFVRTQWDVRHLESATVQLDEIIGALGVVPLPKAVALLTQAKSYIQDHLLQGRQPNWTELDYFADGLSGVDYYLERITQYGASGIEEVIGAAQKGFGELGEMLLQNEAVTPPEEQEKQGLMLEDAAKVLEDFDPFATQPSENEKAEDEEAEDAQTDDAQAEIETIIEPLATAEDSIEQNEPTIQSTQLEEPITTTDTTPVWGAEQVEEVSPTPAAEVDDLESNGPDAAAQVFDDSDSTAVDAPVVVEPGMPTPVDENVPTIIELEVENEENLVIEFVTPGESPTYQPESDTVVQTAQPVEQEQELETQLEDTEEQETQVQESQVPPPAVIEQTAEVAPQTPEEVEPPLAETIQLQPETDETQPVSPEPVQDWAPPHADPEIIEIFIEEAGEVLDGVDLWLPQWRQCVVNEDTDSEQLLELRRAFHTLKGSGRIVQAAAIGELAWGIENMLNRAIDGTIVANEQFVHVVELARNLLPSLIQAFEQQTDPDLDGVGSVIDQADMLASGGELHLSTTAPARSLTPSDQLQVQNESGDGLTVDQPDLHDATHESSQSVELGPEESDEAWLDESLSESAGINSSGFELFVAEASEYLRVVDVENAKVPWRMSDTMVRAFHSLAGSSAIAGISQVQLIVEPTYQVVEAFKQDSKTTGLQYFIVEAAQHLRACFDALSAGEIWDEPLDFVAQADDLLARQPQALTTAQRLVESSAVNETMDADGAIAAFVIGEQDNCADLLNALAKVAALAQELGEDALNQLSDALLQALTTATIVGQVPEDCRPIIMSGYEALTAQLNAVVSGIDAPSEPALIEQLYALELDTPQPADENLVRQWVSDEAEAVAEESVQTDPISTASVLVPLNEDTGPDSSLDVPDQAETAPAPAPAPELESAAISEADDEFDDLDVELVDVFFEEAEEICDELESGIVQWSTETENRIYMENLLRGLHTFKGGARLCGLPQLGDMAHDFESYVIEVQSGERLIDDALFIQLNKLYDALTSKLHSVQARVAAYPVEPSHTDHVPDVTASIENSLPMGPSLNDARAEDAPVQTADNTSIEEQQTAASEPHDQPRVENAELETTQPTLTVAGLETDDQAASDIRDEEQPGSDVAAATGERNSQEMVRVGSGLLEELVNLAGEGSILRARIEQGMADFTTSLDEMEITIERLREQLRRLEMETETQILFRHEQTDTPQYDEFDPLEMDRYSQLQQLSKGLAESASDMLDLKETLLFKARESETLLLQQARINTELQEGLMRTRMVPFNRMLPRLRRIVRQVSQELGKEVDLHVQNAEGELDRNLLERMVPPLEHMLRNAVDHGIEATEVRRGAGKPSRGRIDLRLSREGGDVVIEISDDGAGVDVETVRNKAVERQLMADDAQLSEEEIVQFILAPGFTTAKSVTQISGRGVGMDVVHSEVKQLGGSISIASQVNQGTRIVVRVPFTVSVNRALMVSVAEDQYAIPLNNIEGIVLLSPEQLQTLYDGEAKTFEYAGVPYRIRYLGQYLGRGFTGAAAGQNSIPMVLVRSGDHAVAIHVDLVHGSREIVVKSLGPQFAGVGGISGATILGDGSVVVILDLLALVRAQQHQHKGAPHERVVRRGPRCVLVVDDSVTVRKVTSRLLERQGMDVLVAKDGVEAVALLQECKPDVMLLDIEMPRMDGFEVARQVRHDERLSNLPIVMISSRTGDKHKEHANELGVNHFLGKPFQENELLATIDELVTRA